MSSPTKLKIKEFSYNVKCMYFLRTTHFVIRLACLKSVAQICSQVLEVDPPPPSRQHFKVGKHSDILVGINHLNILSPSCFELNTNSTTMVLYFISIF